MKLRPVRARSDSDSNSFQVSNGFGFNRKEEKEVETLEKNGAMKRTFGRRSLSFCLCRVKNDIKAVQADENKIRIGENFYGGQTSINLNVFLDAAFSEEFCAISFKQKLLEKVLFI